MKKEKTPYKLLKLLSDGQYHSGEKLGEQLQISRSAVWKAIKQLNELKLNIDSVTGKGYRIEGGIELLDKEQISKQLSKAHLNKLNQLDLFTSIDSTNHYLLEMAKSNNHDTIACFSETQTNGKGRRERKWISPFGTNIYFSILWQFNKDPVELVGLSLAAAVVVLRAIKRYGIDAPIKLKWPNDLLYKNRKIGGILVEMVAQTHQSTNIILGIGLNTRMSSHQANAIEQPWVSLEEINKNIVERNRLAGILLDECVLMLNQFETDGLNAFIDEWREHDAFKGKSVLLHTPNHVIKGIAQGITDKGELILLDSDKKTQHYLSGEISVRLET